MHEPDGARAKVVPPAMMKALRHIADRIQWAELGEEELGTGKRHPGAHSVRHIPLAIG